MARYLFIRSDDLTRDTAGLRALGAMSERHGQVMIGAIPSQLRLVQSCRDFCVERFSIAQHGFSHSDHTGLPASRSEYPAARDPAAVLAELREGRDRVREFFGPQAARDFIPPWNRFSYQFGPALAELGFRSVSTYLPAGVEVIAGVPHMGHSVNFSTSYRRDGPGPMPGDAGFQRLEIYAQRFSGTTGCEDVYGSLCLHHDMMTDVDFSRADRFLQLAADAGWRVCGADQAIDGVRALMRELLAIAG